MEQIPGPFTGSSERRFGAPASESHVTEFESEDGVQMVRKVMYPTHLTGKPETVAANKRLVYEVLKEYLRGYIPETHYVVAEYREGQPTVQIVQRKIEGRTWRELDDEGLITPELVEQRRELMRLVREAADDPRLEDVREAYRIGEAYSIPDNIIVDSNGRIHPVDW